LVSDRRFLRIDSTGAIRPYMVWSGKSGWISDEDDAGNHSPS
jgi:hypothetical protein